MDIKKELTPKEYFDLLKEKKHTITDDELVEIYNNGLTLAEKYVTTEQTAGLKKLIFHLESIEKEREIVKMGINTFVYRDDVDEYIDDIAKDVVKLIELERYEREIPDEIVEVIKQTKGKFDQLYILFTDYTGKMERQVEKERREKDPILFGTFQDEKSRAVIDRFYFLGDWADEYCDLTLDKMINEFQNKKHKQIANTIDTPTNIDNLKSQLSQLEIKQGKVRVNNTKKKESLFHKVRTFLKR
ncbi:hypothetical protein FDC62_08800 [Clostridium botulinum]|uniref:hypothetical protein n=1 Tax=Clostridium botulinum TaxID=1491 RepID=UPI000993B3EC|nr:hypothetical protein [Clostridium botulinum]NFO98300.1 hypothetical protein [Clostridium botulinum]OOV52409.1 hypothetical protein B1A66_04355 [Clostridium botulinum D/C]OOV55721.1 hypothetical protein B1A67_07680 [Clostridium botulinum D/C]OOV57168.1 hypothetical protein B0673_04760 [Clostridium botulinum D/C]